MSVDTSVNWDISELLEEPTDYRHKIRPQDKALSQATGVPITALCGFVGRVRKGKPSKDLCPRCQVLASTLKQSKRN